MVDFSDWFISTKWRLWRTLCSFASYSCSCLLFRTARSHRFCSTLWASSRSSIAPGSQVPMWGARGGGYPGGISWMHRRREPVWDGFFGGISGAFWCVGQIQGGCGRELIQARRNPNVNLLLEFSTLL